MGQGAELNFGVGREGVAELNIGVGEGAELNIGVGRGAELNIVDEDKWVYNRVK